jgi:tRNA threonylcarbamoyl adenosine modification protein (Sua5/YciO/YrdC/YwlC family)
MSQYFNIHPTHPEQRLLRQAVAILRKGGVIVYPTDSCYAFGCQIGEKKAVDRIRQLRQLSEDHLMTLICRNLSELSTYAHVDNATFRLLRAYTPGPYTFLLPATSDVPKRLQHPKRKTIGLRIPKHPIVAGLLELLDEPMMSSTLILPGMDAPLIEAQAMRELLSGRVDLIIDGGNCGIEPTTVIDLVQGTPQVLRKGKGDVRPFVGDL